MINLIKIRNFKSIREMELKLLPINVLIGANGAGKSNFINFFKLIYNIYTQNLQNYIAEEAGAENILYNGLKESERLLGRIEFDKTNAYSFTLKPNQQGNLFFEYDITRFYHGFGKTGWDEIPLGNGYLESRLKNEEGGRYKYVKKYMSSFKIFHFHDTSKTAKIKQKGNIDDNQYLFEDAGNLAAFLYFLQEKHPKSFIKIEMLIRSVAPYFDCFVLEPDKIREDKIQLSWKQKGSDMRLYAMQLSDGTLRFMALATLLLQPEIPSTIIIDEPELGLHPFAINKLAGLIKKASAQSQIIISTQSINLVDNFSPEDIITVDREDNQSVFVRQNSESLSDWLQEYSIGDLWNKNVIGGTP
ncbi:AAA family ATPase [Arcicella sp. LKC2W]|uniref:AAA family ATPase n=1 Tax=Arcicella sp. LKC2W TaxID=2984198 RepID=UPI002B20250A|nr:AAA family ATPase [Arcicella sp. LKC2W]MEA5458122.1 AAA family ATPase [Arcicella sp. LKC2W]